MTEAEWIALIIAALGGDTEGGLLAAELPAYWETVRADIADLNVRALFVKIDAIDLLLGQAARQVTFRTSSGSSVNLSDLFDHFLRLRGFFSAQLAAAAPGGGVAIGTLTKTAPLMPPTSGEPDPNAQRYRGDTRRWRP